MSEEGDEVERGWLRWRTASVECEVEETLSGHRVARWCGEVVNQRHCELSREMLDEWLET